MIISRLPSGGGSSNGENLNVFTQMDEPETKDGIWIKTNKKYKQVVTAEKLFEDDGTFETLPPLPISNALSTAGCGGAKFNGKLYFIIADPSVADADCGIYTYSRDEGWTKIAEKGKPFGTGVLMTYNPITCFVAKGMLFTCTIATDGRLYIYAICADGTYSRAVNLSNDRYIYSIGLVNDNIMCLPYTFNTGLIINTSQCYTYDLRQKIELNGREMRYSEGIFRYIRAGRNTLLCIGSSTAIYAHEKDNYYFLSEAQGYKYGVKTYGINDAPHVYCDGSFYYVRNKNKDYTVNGTNFTNIITAEIVRTNVEDKNGYLVTSSSPNTGTTVAEIPNAVSPVKSYQTNGNFLVADCEFYCIGGGTGTTYDGSNPGKGVYKYKRGTQKKQDANAIIFVKTDGANVGNHIVKLLKLGEESQPFAFDDIVVTDENGTIQFDAPIYYGDGTAWYSLNGITE